jgi:hypothetical protein
MGYREGRRVKSSAEEEDSDAVVEEVMESSGIGFEGLDFGVKPLGNSISGENSRNGNLRTLVPGNRTRSR